MKSGSDIVRPCRVGESTTSPVMFLMGLCVYESVSHYESPDDLPRPKLASYQAGHVFLMPGGATWLNHDKPRPFALASSPGPSDMGVLAYGSTRETERWAGAACVEVMPATAGVNANGLRAKTIFFPGVLIQVAFARLPPHLGKLGKSLAEFKRALHDVLGIGTGTCSRPGAPAGSRRGRLVRLKDAVAADFRTTFAVVLTEHAYSRENHYQLLVPILRSDAIRRAEHGIHVEDKEWLHIFAKPTTRAVLPVDLIQSAWYDSDIAGETPFVIDSASLGALEERLCAMFGIEAPRG